MAYTINWDQISSITANKHIARLKDQIFLDNPLLMRLNNRKKEYDGGPVIVVPLGHAVEGGGGVWYAGTDKFDTRIRNTITAANFAPKMASIPLAISGEDELRCNGPQAVLNLLTAKTRIAENTAKALISGDLYNNATNPKAIGGLQYALRYNIVASAYTYGGITAGGAAPAADANGWWQHNADVTGTYATGDPGTFMGVANNPVSKMWAQIALRSSKAPSLILSNWGSWTDYHNSLYKKETYQRPQQDTALAKAGFTNLMYRTAPWVADPRAPRGGGGTYYENVYLLDEEAISLYVHPSRDFSFEPFRKPHDQDAKVAYIFWMGELAFDERRSSGVIYNVNTSATLAA